MFPQHLGIFLQLDSDPHQDEGFTFVLKGYATYLLADPYVDLELFDELPGQTPLERFMGVALAAGELPLAMFGTAGGAACEKQLSFAPRNPGGSYDASLYAMIVHLVRRGYRKRTRKRKKWTTATTIPAVPRVAP